MGGDFNVELGPGFGVRDWMKHWPMLHNFIALNTMYRKTPEKQATYRTPKGVEKQLDYILVDRKHMCCSRDAEANGMMKVMSFSPFV